MADKKSKSKAPTEVDRHIAQRLRDRRRETGKSQQSLAKAVGVSFQQIQKYENGRNRISASRLQAILAELEVPPAYIYEGLPLFGQPDGGFREAPESAYVADDAPLGAEGRELVEAFVRIGDPTVRRHVLALVRTLAEAPAAPKRGRRPRQPDRSL